MVLNFNLKENLDLFFKENILLQRAMHSVSVKKLFQFPPHP
jgi:hypothetical protein